MRAEWGEEAGGEESEDDEEDGEGEAGAGAAAPAPAPPPPPPRPPPSTAPLWTDPPWWPPPLEDAAFGDTTYTLLLGEDGAAPRMPAPAAPPPPLAAGSHAQAGARGADRMEDETVVACPLPTAPGSGPGHLLAVFDGHRGAGAARHAAAGVVEAVRAAWCGGGGGGGDAPPSPPPFTHPAQALAAAFASLHESWLAVEAAASAAASAVGRPPPSPCGATATLALVWRDWLFVACAGDARAVLVTAAGNALRMSTDHVAADASERARCVAAVGQAAAGLRCLPRPGGWRLGPPGLAVTRALGDVDALASGLTPAPTIIARRLAGGASRDAALVLASDGLWDVCSDSEAARAVRDTVKEPSLAAKRLVTDALGAGSGDNVSAVVAFLRAETTCEAVFMGGRAV